ncbi:MAG: glycosyltransferase, exosortase A system-associated [Rhodospirillaceae bacterium]|jgi:PEP-CTERM/exosortase A-associated glycosyltransferase|nr:glycosyltransferase, exosortase A system-associated [Rhodospirillaceae bacterium]MBT5457092.1 glycosyltransferase, exosortase A system-associated [Rhodospirillaceae bacterium]
MRILHILDHSIPLQSGYTFRTLSILQQQRALGWETFHLTSPKHTRPFVAQEEVDGWSFYRTPPIEGPGAKLPVLRELALINATASRLAQVAPEIRPDILHAHSPVLNAIPALRVGRKLGIPVVYEVRAFWEDAAASHGTSSEGGPRYQLTRALESWALRRASAVTTICEGLRGDIVARGIPEDRVTVIPNAVNVDEFSGGAPGDPTLAHSLGLTGKTVLGFLGSFYSYEGLHHALQAMPKILAANEDVRLLLVGGGPEDERLRQTATQMGLADKIIFTGRVPHAEVQKYYDLVDVLVYPRIPIRLTDLVTPLKPLEAMALNKVIVASDVGGHRELIRDGETGNLFAAGDIDDLAATVLRVLDSRYDWPGQIAAGRHFVEQERSWRNSVARYAPVYERLVAGDPTGGVAAAATSA